MSIEIDPGNIAGGVILGKLGWVVICTVYKWFSCLIKKVWKKIEDDYIADIKEGLRNE